MLGHVTFGQCVAEATHSPPTSRSSGTNWLLWPWKQRPSASDRCRTLGLLQSGGQRWNAMTTWGVLLCHLRFVSPIVLCKISLPRVSLLQKPEWEVEAEKKYTGFNDESSHLHFPHGYLETKPEKCLHIRVSEGNGVSLTEQKAQTTSSTSIWININVNFLHN